MIIGLEREERRFVYYLKQINSLFSKVEFLPFTVTLASAVVR